MDAEGVWLSGLWVVAVIVGLFVVRIALVVSHWAVLAVSCGLNFSQYKLSQRAR